MLLNYIFNNNESNQDKKEPVPNDHCGQKSPKERKMNWWKKTLKKQKKDNKKTAGITLIALVVTTIFSYDENIKSSNSKGFLLQTI